VERLKTTHGEKQEVERLKTTHGEKQEPDAQQAEQNYFWYSNPPEDDKYSSQPTGLQQPTVLQPSKNEQVSQVHHASQTECPTFTPHPVMTEVSHRSPDFEAHSGNEMEWGTPYRATASDDQRDEEAPMSLKEEEELLKMMQMMQMKSGTRSEVRSNEEADREWMQSEWMRRVAAEVHYPYITPDESKRIIQEKERVKAIEMRLLEYEERERVHMMEMRLREHGEQERVHVMEMRIRDLECALFEKEQVERGYELRFLETLVNPGPLIAIS